MERLKTQICSIEQSKKLLELGINFQSYFYYVTGWKNPIGILLDDGEEVINQHQQHITRVTARNRNADIQIIPAYNVSELGVMLPDELYHMDNCLYCLKPWTYMDKGWVVDFRMVYQSNKNPQDRIPNKYIITNSLESRTRACMIIYLLENNLNSVEMIERRYNMYYGIKKDEYNDI